MATPEGVLRRLGPRERALHLDRIPHGGDGRSDLDQRLTKRF